MFLLAEVIYYVSDYVRRNVVDIHMEFQEQIKKISFSKLISHLSGLREVISSGQGIGKFLEYGFVRMFNRNSLKLECFHMALYNSKIKADILVYEKGKITEEEIKQLLKQHKNKEKFFLNINKKTKTLGVSLKNYLNQESQMSTDYVIRDLLEQKINQQDGEETNDVYFFIDYIKNFLKEENILMFNTYDNKVDIRLIDPSYLDKLKIDKIRYDLKKKHSRYVFMSNGVDVFHSKYGKKTANAFQRGIWIDNMDSFPLLKSEQINNISNVIIKNKLDKLLLG